MLRKNWAWTTEDEGKLRDHVAKGAHLRILAIRLKRSEASIKMHARALNVQIQPKPRSSLSMTSPKKAG